jgi:hypothetical protein
MAPSIVGHYATPNGVEPIAVRKDREEVLQMAAISSTAEQRLGTIETNIRARLDRLPWSPSPHTP